MKAVFTCGGTGGHINPALAVARVLLERRPDSEILFVGAEDGMEATLVPREGFRLETLQISSYMRSLKPSAIRHNVRAALSIRRALKRRTASSAISSRTSSSGTGGYASYPMLHEGARLGIPTAVHESNAVPGLATKMVADKVDRILVSFADSRLGPTATRPVLSRSVCPYGRSSSSPAAPTPAALSASTRRRR